MPYIYKRRRRKRDSEVTWIPFGRKAIRVNVDKSSSSANSCCLIISHCITFMTLSNSDHLEWNCAKFLPLPGIHSYPEF